jgi:phosphate transport system permease protein
MDEPEGAGVSMAASSAQVPDSREAHSSPSSVGHSSMLSTPPSGDLSRRTRQRGDAIFRMLAQGSGVLLLVIMAAIAVFLVLQTIPALKADTTSFLTTLKWDPDGTPSSFGIAALAFGSALTSLLALLMSVPVAVGVALATSHYAPRWLARPLAYVVDLLAAVPSVVFGLWGLIYLVPNIIPLSKFLNQYLGFIPLFGSNGTYGKSIFAASVVLAVMVIPIVAAISREVFVQTPRDNIEAAWAIGATKWEVIRTAVLPYGRSGVISGTVLGFGRAIGETIAVALVLSSNYGISIHILQPGGNTIAANIANSYGEAGDVGRGALIASGLVLFVITLIVNFGPRAIVGRSGRGGSS